MADKRQDSKEQKDDSGFDEAGSREDLSLEASFERLDEILESLESRELPLEEAFSLYQRGVELLKQCNEKIDTVEKKILIMNGDGELDEF